MKNLLYGLLLLSLVTCTKDEVPYERQAFNDCLHASSKSIPPQTGADYVSCKINGKKVLMSDGYDGYRQFANLGATYVTSGPELSLGDSSIRYTIFLGFDQPTKKTTNEPFSEPYDVTSDQIYLTIQSKENQSAVDLFDNYIKVGDLKLKQAHEWETSDPELLDGVEINYWCYCNCSEDGYAPHTILAFTSSDPDQPGYLKCTELQRNDLGDSVLYHVEFQFECTLYYYHYKTKGVIGKLKEGKMVADFTLKK